MAAGGRRREQRFGRAVLPDEVSPRVARVLDATGWARRGIASRSGGVAGILLLGKCPACISDDKSRDGAKSGTAHIGPVSGSLRCKREKCRAGRAISGVNERTGEAIGIPLLTWVSELAPEALGELARSARPAAAEHVVATLAEGERRLRSQMVAAIEWTAEASGRVAVVVAPTGLGKTRIALQCIAETKRGTFLAASHRALDERESEAGALMLVKRRRFRGVVSSRADEARSCVYRTSVLPLAQAGYPIRSKICTGCPHLNSFRDTGGPCPAHEGVEGVGVRFAVYKHLRGLVANDELKRPLIVDELPALVDTLSVPVAVLARVAAYRTSDTEFTNWCDHRAQFAKILLAAGHRLAAEYREARPRYAVRTGGPELRHHLVRAAEEVLYDGQASFAVVEDRRAGEDILLFARSALTSAHDRARMPPLPSGELVRAGKIDIKTYPPAFLDDVLLALVLEGTPENPARGIAACVRVDGPWNEPDVTLELRRRSLDDWLDRDGRPLSVLVLDASAPFFEAHIQAALPGREIRLFRVEVPEPSHVTYRHHATAEFTRRALFGRSRDGRLAGRGLKAVVRLLRDIARLVPEGIGDSAHVGIVTHRPLAEVLSGCIRVLDGKGDLWGDDLDRLEANGHQPILDELEGLRRARLISDIAVLYFGNQRGSNVMKDIDLLLCVGDPWPDIGGATEEARALGVEADGYIGAMLASEVRQVVGRARALRRSPDQFLSVSYFGNERPNLEGFRVSEPAACGGPIPSAFSKMCEGLALATVDRWGATSPALLRFVANRPGTAAWLDQRSATAIGRDGLNSRYTASTLSDRAVLAASEVSPEIQAAAFCRAVGHLREVTVRAPPGHSGHWRLREKRFGAARAIARALRDMLTAASAQETNGRAAG